MRLAFVALVLLLSAPAHANPCTRAQEVHSGATAPCAGILVPTQTVDALLAIQEDRDRLRAQLAKDAEDYAAERERMERDAEAAGEAWRTKLASCDRRARGCEARLEEIAEPDAWWTSPVLWGVVGVAVGVTVGVVVAR